jgi:creatinine amidohydrolase
MAGFRYGDRHVNGPVRRLREDCVSDSVFVGEISWPEFQRRVSDGATAFVPVGATEQHGRHMPLGVDAILPTAVCAEVAKRCGGMVVPTIPYGNRSQPRSGGGAAFPGTINLTAETFALLLRDVISELFRHGVRRIVVVNGHYENVWPSIEGIERALDHIGRDRLGGLKIVRIDSWEMIRPETLVRVFPDGYPGIELEHASVIETSMMLVLRPELVDLAKAANDGPARFKPYDRFPGPVPEVPASGVLSLTEGSSAEKGRWLLEDTINGIERAVVEEFGL